jgi:hypothetical protein
MPTRSRGHGTRRCCRPWSTTDSSNRHRSSRPSDGKKATNWSAVKRSAPVRPGTKNRSAGGGILFHCRETGSQAAGNEVSQEARRAEPSYNPRRRSTAAPGSRSVETCARGLEGRPADDLPSQLQHLNYRTISAQLLGHGTRWSATFVGRCSSQRRPTILPSELAPLGGFLCNMESMSLIWPPSGGYGRVHRASRGRPVSC